MGEQSLFERLGGGDAVSAVVDAFYDKITADNKYNDVFKSVNVTVLRGMMKKFLTQATGGPQLYDGKNMRDAHKNVYKSGYPTEEVFNAIVDVLVQTLQDFKVPDNLIGELGAIVGSVKADVLGQ